MRRFPRFLILSPFLCVPFVACTQFSSTSVNGGDDAGSDAASRDGSGPDSAGGGDSEGGQSQDAGSSYCSTLPGSALFCDDFDEPDTLARAGITFSPTPAAFKLNASSFVSSPFALGVQEPGASVSASLNGTLTAITVEFDVDLSSVDSGGGSYTFATLNGTLTPAAPNLWSMSLGVSGHDIFVYALGSSVAAGETNFSTSSPFIHIRAVLSNGVLNVDMKDATENDTPFVINAAGAQSIDSPSLMIGLYPSGGPGGTVNFDNVVVTSP